MGKLLFESFPELSSDRFELVEIKAGHAVDLFELYGDRKVTEYFDLLPLQSIDEAKKEVEFYRNRFKNKTGIRWGISYKGKSEIVGTLGFNLIVASHKAKIGYDLKSKYWGKGIMTEALECIIDFGFDELHVKRIEAEIMLGNIRSEKLLSKLNFQKEGILRDWMYWNDKYYDISMYSLIKEERKQ